MKTLNRIFLVLSLLVIVACDNRVASLTTDGQETHGGDLMATSVKAGAYTMIGAVQAEYPDLRGEDLIWRIAKMPLFSTAWDHTRISLKRVSSPIPHWVLNRRAMLDPSKLLIDRIQWTAFELIAEVAIEEDDHVILQHLANRNFGMPSFSLRQAWPEPRPQKDKMLAYVRQAAMQGMAQYHMCKSVATRYPIHFIAWKRRH